MLIIINDTSNKGHGGKQDLCWYQHGMIVQQKLKVEISFV